MHPRCCAPWPALILAMVAAALTPAAAPAQTTEPGASAARMESAGWKGRAIREPRRSQVDVPASRWPAGWSAGAVSFGTGYAAPDGSARVRAVQRMLRGLGYRPGPVDGRFGPRTAAATGWFQYKHGLPSTGTVDARTLATLRTRARGEKLGTTQRTSASPERGRTNLAEAPAPAAPAAPATSDTDGGATDVTPILLALALGAWGAFMVAQLRSRTPETAAVEAPERPLSVLGYVALDRDELQEGIPPDVLDAIDAHCERRGWSLMRVVHDVEPASGRMNDRPGLFHALQEIGTGRAHALVTPRLQDLTTSVSDLGQLMRWFDEADARLVVLGLPLDTGSEPGRLTAQALLEVSEWERRRIGERTRSGLAAAVNGRRGTSREAVADDPELAAWIERMRSDGMSLQAIADTLNAHNVPTRRGGAQWRPSSVQRTVGYKRPTARRTAPELPPPNGAGG